MPQAVTHRLLTATVRVQFEADNLGIPVEILAIGTGFPPRTYFGFTPLVLLTSRFTIFHYPITNAT